MSPDAPSQWTKASESASSSDPEARPLSHTAERVLFHMTVTDFAKLRGLSMSYPRLSAT